MHYVKIAADGTIEAVGEGQALPDPSYTECSEAAADLHYAELQAVATNQAALAHANMVEGERVLAAQTLIEVLTASPGTAEALRTALGLP